MQHLFSDFKPVSAAEWKNQLVKDLKGEAYENLVWKNENGFDIDPFYTADTTKTAYEPAFTHAGWDICLAGKPADAKMLNKQLLHALESGASAVSVDCEGLDLSVALKDVQLNYIQSTFFVDEKSAAELKEYLEKNYDLNAVQCSLFPKQLSAQQDLQSWKKISSLFKGHKTLKPPALIRCPFTTRIAWPIMK